MDLPVEVKLNDRVMYEDHAGIRTYGRVVDLSCSSEPKYSGSARMRTAGNYLSDWIDLRQLSHAAFDPVERLETRLPKLPTGFYFEVTPEVQSGGVVFVHLWLCWERLGEGESFRLAERTVLVGDLSMEDFTSEILMSAVGLVGCLPKDNKQFSLALEVSGEYGRKS